MSLDAFKACKTLYQLVRATCKRVSPSSSPSPAGASTASSAKPQIDIRLTRRDGSQTVHSFTRPPPGPLGLDDSALFDLSSETVAPSPCPVGSETSKKKITVSIDISGGGSVDGIGQAVALAPDRLHRLGFDNAREEGRVHLFVAGVGALTLSSASATIQRGRLYELVSESTHLLVFVHGLLAPQSPPLALCASSVLGSIVDLTLPVQVWGLSSIVIRVREESIGMHVSESNFGAFAESQLKSIFETLCDTFEGWLKALNLGTFLVSEFPPPPLPQLLSQLDYSVPSVAGPPHS
jgi:hypothetical protein